MTLSFPIKLCKPKSALENAISFCIWDPIFLGLAARTNDPVERVKLFALNVKAMDMLEF